MKDIDTLSLELTEEMLSKALPPKILYRFRKWMRTKRPKSVHDALALKSEEKIHTIADLAKNETMASFFESGHIKMDFGSAVPEKVKKAALEWAKRKGLKAIEASLAKSANSPSSVTFSSSDSYELGQCARQIKWSC